MISLVPFSFSSQLIPIKQLLSPYTHRAYLVGGSVRDLLLNNEPSDLDIEVYDVLPQQFDLLMQKAGADGVGKSYFVYKLDELDLSLPRTENKVGVGHKAFEVNYCNNELQASARRDFTINSIMLNIFTGELLDLHGGVRDLENGVIRHVNSEKFAEDSLRILRGVRFASKFGFKIAPETIEFMKTLSLRDISKDRIGNELIKIFKTKHQDIGVKYLQELDLFKELFSLSLSYEEAQDFGKRVKQAFAITRDPRQFLYLLHGMFGLSDEVLENLRLPNDFRACFRQPFGGSGVSKAMLLKMAFAMPIREWLGANTPQVVKLAKELGVYDKSMRDLDIYVDGNEVVRDGFTGAAVGGEIRKRQDEIVEQILEGRIKI